MHFAKEFYNLLKFYTPLCSSYNLYLKSLSIINKDISYDSKLNESKISHFWIKIFKGTQFFSISFLP